MKYAISWWRSWGNFTVGGLILLALGLAILAPPGHSTPPGLSIGPITNGYIGLTITNGVSTNFYEIYTKQDLLESLPWSGSITGYLGQTNFSVEMGIATMRFFKARDGNDWDADGVQNFQDGNPNDSNIGVLSVTIDVPANGATIY